MLQVEELISASKKIYISSEQEFVCSLSKMSLPEVHLPNMKNHALTSI